MNGILTGNVFFLAKVPVLLESLRSSQEGGGECAPHVPFP